MNHSWEAERWLCAVVVRLLLKSCGKEVRVTGWEGFVCWNQSHGWTCWTCRECRWDGVATAIWIKRVTFHKSTREGDLEQVLLLPWWRGIFILTKRYLCGWRYSSENFRATTPLRAMWWFSDSNHETTCCESKQLHGFWMQEIGFILSLPAKGEETSFGTSSMPSSIGQEHMGMLLQEMTERVAAKDSRNKSDDAKVESFLMSFCIFRIPSHVTQTVTSCRSLWFRTHRI